MTPPHRENSHTKGSLGFRSDFAFGVRKKERFTGPIQDLSEDFGYGLTVSGSYLGKPKCQQPSEILPDHNAIRSPAVSGSTNVVSGFKTPEA